jgi:DNA-binding FadR family transcriptional regulator
MNGRERMKVVTDAKVELFRWIRDGRSGDMDRLPSIRALSRRFGVATSSIREAIQALEALGLIHTTPKRGSVPVDPERVLRVDAIPLWIHGADSRQQLGDGVRPFCEL